MSMWQIGLALFIGIILVGVLFEIISAALDRQRYKTPLGKLIDVNGKQQHLYVTGAKQNDSHPTVILDAGIGSNSLDWQFVQPRIAEFAQIASYDRAGYGWSEAASTSRSPEQIAEDLHSLLKAAGLKAPYLLVGHSFGGIYNRVFLEKYPDEVVGLILVDSSHPEALKALNTKPELQRLRRVALLKRLGLLRLMLPRLFYRADYLLADAKKQYLAFIMLDSDNVIREAQPMFEDGVDLPETVGAIPLTVISRATDEDSESEQKWHDYQLKLVALAPHSKHIISEKTGHYLALADPNLIVDVVREMLEG